MNNALAVLALTFFLSGVAQANPFVEGDAEAGKAKAVTCAACHGPDGNSVNPQWPSLAGQHADYILGQLKAFKAGARMDPLMTGQAMQLSEQDMQDLAVYYAGLSRAAKAVAEPASTDLGARLYRGGDDENNTSACIACHGPRGLGNPGVPVPSVKGQHAVYSAAQLRAYASGQRKTDGPTREMRDIAATLSEEDIRALSSYMQGLQ